MVTITTWFQLGTLGMVLGTVAMVWAARYVPDEQTRENSLLIAVGVIAALAYGLMALGISAITTADGDTIYLARYVDWLLTTPLHVVYLGLMAEATRRQLGEIAGFQALTIVFGLAGTYVSTPLNWVFFLAGSVAFARVLQLLYGPIKTRVETVSDTSAELYSKLLNFIAVLWLIYPVIWVLAQGGFGLLDLETQSLVISYIDVVAKIGFGLIALNGQATAAMLDSDGEVTTGAPSAD